MQAGEQEPSPAFSTPDPGPFLLSQGDDIQYGGFGEKKRNKLGYHRTSVACGHCRRRKIRCIPSPTDTKGRCSNCIRLKKECTFIPADQTQTPIQRSDLNTPNSHSSSSSPRPPLTSDSVVGSSSSHQVYVPFTVTESDWAIPTAAATSNNDLYGGSIDADHTYTLNSQSITNYMLPDGLPVFPTNDTTGMVLDDWRTQQLEPSDATSPPAASFPATWTPAASEAESYNNLRWDTAPISPMSFRGDMLGEHGHDHYSPMPLAGVHERQQSATECAGDTVSLEGPLVPSMSGAPGLSNKTTFNHSGLPRQQGMLPRNGPSYSINLYQDGDHGQDTAPDFDESNLYAKNQI